MDRKQEKIVLRRAILEDVRTIEPLDGLEAEHQRDAIEWIESGAELSRQVKPATPPSLMNLIRNERMVVYAMVLAEPGYVHEADCHIKCAEAVLDLQDGIPQYVEGPDSEPMEEPLQTRVRPRRSQNARRIGNPNSST